MGYGELDQRAINTIRLLAVRFFHELFAPHFLTCCCHSAPPSACAAPPLLLLPCLLCAEADSKLWRAAMGKKSHGHGGADDSRVYESAFLPHGASTDGFWV